VSRVAWLSQTQRATLFSHARVIGKVGRYACFHSDTRHSPTSYAPSIGYTCVPLYGDAAILAVVIPAAYLIEKINRPALNNSPCMASAFLPRPYRSTRFDIEYRRVDSTARKVITLIARVSSIRIEVPDNPATLTRSIQSIVSSVVTRDYPTKNRRGHKVFNEPGCAITRNTPRKIRAIRDVITPCAARIPRATLSRTSGPLYDPEVLRGSTQRPPRAVFRPAIFHYGS